jgi:molybdate transport system substrate-binding protein
MLSRIRPCSIGRAAVAALRHERLYERVREKFVLGENISQTAQFAQSGNADVAIVALSLTSTPALKTSGTFVEIPDSFHPPINQAAAILSRSRQKNLARRFVDYLEPPESRQVLRRYGFTSPR